MAAVALAERIHGQYCGSCGLKLLDPAADSCPRCLAAFAHRSSPPRRNRVTAALLAFFFGAVGAHRFYLGQYALGFLHVAFCWSGIPGIVGIVDFVRFLIMPEERFAAAHGRRAGGGPVVAAVVVGSVLLLAGIGAVVAALGVVAQARAAQSVP